MTLKVILNSESKLDFFHKCKNGEHLIKMIKTNTVVSSIVTTAKSRQTFKHTKTITCMLIHMFNRKLDK